MSAPLLLGSAALLGGAGLVTAAARLWPAAARGRYRAASAGPSPAAAAALEDALLQLAAGLPPAAFPAADEKPMTADDLAARIAAGEVDGLEYDTCPRERRTRPHAIGVDGSRRCWHCGHETAGNPVTISELGPEYVRPRQPTCPKCTCCPAPLCANGRLNALGCHGLADREVRESVYGCPCSAASTRGTHAWRAEQIRVTVHATEHPLPLEIEDALRDVAEFGPEPAGTVAAQLRVHGLVTEAFEGHAITEAGRTYLAVRGGRRHVTPAQVLAIDLARRTASVSVECWQGGQPVTVLLDYLTARTGLPAQALPGTWLEAEANCRAPHADDVVLTRIRTAPRAGTEDTIALRTLAPRAARPQEMGSAGAAPSTSSSGDSEPWGGDA
ncbi:hypothetical protein ABZ820_12845 [Streptomyces diacarni]|uniref:hypothetical protein n=1 Tax=Streptomyces diacarni TaxID=2800381 RepID=UPI0033D28B38